MATLPPGIMQAGLPGMAPPMEDISAQTAPSMPSMPPVQQQPMPQPAMPQAIPPADAMEQNFDTLFNAIDPILDSRAGDQFADDYGRAMETGQSVQGLPAKAVKQSFTLGIKELSTLLSQGQHSDGYFPKSSQNILQDSADVYASLHKFMTAKTPQSSQKALDAFRHSIKDLPNVSRKITNITNRSQQGQFMQDMQNSNDAVVTQIIGDAVSNIDNGATAMEYLITGKAQPGMPEPMVMNQANQLWLAVSKQLSNMINQQIEALIVQALAGIIRSEMLSQTMTPDGQLDPMQLQSTVMSQAEQTQRKLATIQQITNAIFTPATTAKIQQPQLHPINKQSINHYTQG